MLRLEWMGNWRFHFLFVLYSFCAQIECIDTPDCIWFSDTIPFMSRTCVGMSYRDAEIYIIITLAGHMYALKVQV